MATHQELLEDWIGTGWMLDSLASECSVTLTDPDAGQEADLATVCAHLRAQGYAVCEECAVWGDGEYGPAGEPYVTVHAVRGEAS